MSKQTIKPDQAIVKRLLMRIDPLFFTYDKSKQDKARQSYYHQYDDMIMEFLFKHVFEIEFEHSVENEDKLTKVQHDLFNAYTTAIIGIGENSFLYNEYQAEDFDLRIYPTLYDYDFQEFHFQQNAFKENTEGDFKDKPYRLHINNNWVRMIDTKGCFYYSNQTSLSKFVISKLVDHAEERMHQLIPYSFVEGPNHDKKTKRGFVWDLNVDAKGLEKQLEELEDRYRKYLNEVSEEMDETFHENAECAVYFKKSTEGDVEPKWDVIIKNSNSAKNIYFQTYLKDCEKFLKPYEELEVLYQKKLEKLDAFINENYQDVMENFDPKVSRLKRKMNVIIAPGALDGLTHMRDEEE